MKNENAMITVLHNTIETANRLTEKGYRIESVDIKAESPVFIKVAIGASFYKPIDYTAKGTQSGSDDWPADTKERGSQSGVYPQDHEPS